MRTSILLGSITDLRSEHAGRVIVVGSHGARVTGLHALHHAVGALVCHDAGIGLEEAGVAALAVLDGHSVPAIAVDCWSARIGDPTDMAKRGVVSRCNEAALALMIAPGDRIADVLAVLSAAAGRQHASSQRYLAAEFRRTELPAVIGHRAIALDSASSVEAGDEGAIVITGSHGGLPGGSNDRAIKTRPLLASFNDAGIGIDSAGVARLPALDQQAIAAVCVAAATARIGDGLSTYETGVISFANGTARSLGASTGMTMRRLIAIVAADGRTSLDNITA